ncbi:Phosphate transport system regulatory protein PhoU [hydrothermal vent metagenome]|uniref:Phosphate transport system regulatory protein PhoU n=1 Tax=hydrothermal vent metagenome TaxID=652676 RepID=A0A3B1C301_9ZZZZ
MSKHLQRDIENLKKEILSLGSMVVDVIDKAVLALIDRQTEFIDYVVNNDDRINEKEVAIEEECLKILALHQPVAGDLRFIIVVLKMNDDLERMGDLAVNIAKRARYLSGKEKLNVSLDFAMMAGRVQTMVRVSLDSLINKDTAMARNVLKMDDEVDDLNRQMYEALQKVMQDDPATIKRAIHTLSSSRHLERIADLATNIAEDVVFMVDGDLIRHRTEDYLDASSD